MARADRAPLPPHPADSAAVEVRAERTPLSAASAHARAFTDAPAAAATESEIAMTHHSEPAQREAAPLSVRLNRLSGEQDDPLGRGVLLILANDAAKIEAELTSLRAMKARAEKVRESFRVIPRSPGEPDDVSDATLDFILNGEESD